MRMSRINSTSRRSRVCLALLAIAIPVVLSACGSQTSSTSSTSTGPTGGSTSSSWVQDDVHHLDIFLPEGNAEYYLSGFGTADGARTVITGQVPDAVYWSYTAYPVPAGGAVGHVHDTQITQAHGRYVVTIAARCAGVSGTCIATTAAEATGIVALRLYVPVDLYGAGTGGVPLPAISYESASGTHLTLTEASGNDTIQRTLDAYADEKGALPAELTEHYPPAAPVPVAVTEPVPQGRISHSTGKFNNPDNIYEHVRFTTTRGNLVASARAPTYQAGPLPNINPFSRPASAPPQVRYWSLCIVLEDLHTGDCLRDGQVRFPADSQVFTVIVSPTCPVAGYANCVRAGPEPIQVSLALRYTLPSAAFSPDVFQGPYALTAKYVARP